MKKLFLLVGLVVFLTPMLVSAEDVRLKCTCEIAGGRDINYEPFELKCYDVGITINLDEKYLIHVDKKYNIVNIYEDKVIAEEKFNRKLEKKPTIADTTITFQRFTGAYVLSMIYPDATIETMSIREKGFVYSCKKTEKIL